MSGGKGDYHPGKEVKTGEIRKNEINRNIFAKRY